MIELRSHPPAARRRRDRRELLIWLCVFAGLAIAALAAVRA